MLCSFIRGSQLLDDEGASGKKRANFNYILVEAQLDGERMKFSRNVRFLICFW